MLGDRYGTSPLPAVLDGREFNALYREARLTKIPRTDLLEDWYIRDDNACPPVYNLEVSVTMVTPVYNLEVSVINCFIYF